MCVCVSVCVPTFVLKLSHIALVLGLLVYCIAYHICKMFRAASTPPQQTRTQHDTIAIILVFKYSLQEPEDSCALYRFDWLLKWFIVFVIIVREFPFSETFLFFTFTVLRAQHYVGHLRVASGYASFGFVNVRERLADHYIILICYTNVCNDILKFAWLHMASLGPSSSCQMWHKWNR